MRHAVLLKVAIASYIAVYIASWIKYTIAIAIVIMHACHPCQVTIGGMKFNITYSSEELSIKNWDPMW